MSGGGGTTTSNTTVPPEVLAEYQNVTATANQVADTPLTQYQGNIVAGLTPDQLAAMGTVNGAQGMTQAYTDAAGNLVNQATQNINPNTVTSGDIQNYLDPYTQQVLQGAMASQNNQDAIQQQGVIGDAIGKGAWGGDRAGVAQGIMAGQQAIANNSTNAGILSQGYSQAMAEANSQNAAKTSAQEASQYLDAQGALAQNQIGTTALNNTLTGAQAQLATGQQQQQQNQANLNVPYQQFLQQQAYPFQTTGWLANIAEGIGSNTGNQSTTTQPSQGLFGLKSGGIVGHKRGGIVQHFDDGGATDYYENDLNVAGNSDLIPAFQQVESGNNPNAVSPAGAKGIMQVMDATNTNPGFGVVPARDNSPEERARVGRDYANTMLDRYHNKQFGVYDGQDLGAMAYNWGPGHVDKLLSGEIDPSQIPAEAAAYPGKIREVADQEIDPAAYSTTISSDENGILQPTSTPDAMPTATGIVPTKSDYTAEIPKNHEPNPWLSVAAGVLGTLAGRSRNPLIDIGQGGLIGLQNYNEQQKVADAQNYQEGTFANNAQKLAEEADNTRQQLTREQAAQDESSRHNQAIEQMGKFSHFTNPLTGQDGVVDTKTGKIITPQGSAPPARPVDADGKPLTGDAYAASLPDSRANLAKAIVNGDMPWPTGFALKNPIMMQAMNDARAIDPTANANRYVSMTDFTKGQSAKTMQSLDAATAHLDTLQKLVGAMGNGDIKAQNYLSNLWQTQTGQTPPTDFDTAKSLVGDEIVKAVIGSGGGVSDREEAKANLAKSNSADQLASSIGVYRNLMVGQMDALGQRYKNGTGRNDFATRLRPETRDIYVKAKMPQGTQFSPSKQMYRDPSGVMYDINGNPVNK